MTTKPATTTPTKPAANARRQPATTPTDPATRAAPPPAAPARSHGKARRLRLGALRLGIGLAQGALGWIFVNWSFRIVQNVAETDHATHRFAMSLIVLGILSYAVPMVALGELGRMRWRRLLVYLGATSVGLGALLTYSLWRDPVQWRVFSSSLLYTTGAAMFIVNQFVEHRNRGYRLYEQYAVRAHDSWTRCIQCLMSMGVLLLAWALLALSAELFILIHLTKLGRFIWQGAFLSPILCMVLAATVHVTETYPALLRNIRRILLTLMTWMLPLAMVVLGGFLLALVFTGCAPLWASPSAATVLLALAMVTLVLLNAAYRMGDQARLPSAPIRWAARMAGPVMLALTALAAWAIGQRIAQHGLTSLRVLAIASASMLFLYGCGYTWAGLSRGPWLARLGPVNVTASIGVLAVVLALLTPLADPARLAVNSQLARLHAGRIAPENFDYSPLLLFNTGRYGMHALAVLAADANPVIVLQARRALDAQKLVDVRAHPALSSAMIYPHGATLPAGFIESVHSLADSHVNYYTACLYNGEACDIFLLPHGSTKTGIVLVYRPNSARPEKDAAVFERDDAGVWQAIGWAHHFDCPGVLDALHSGNATVTSSLYGDVSANGIHLDFGSDAPDEHTCPPKKTRRAS